MKSSINLMDTYPSISYLKRKAKKRIPNVAWQYLEAGTGTGSASFRNQKQLNKITLLPQFMKGELDIDISTNLFGTRYQTPFGIAPVGLSGLIWPKAEFILAQTAKTYGFPYCLSTVATQTPESVGPIVKDMGWFQLYPPKDHSVLRNILQRAKESGFSTLIITADVPALSRREKSRKAGLTVPLNITPQLIWQCITHPSWLWETVNTGLPHLKTVEPYSDSKDMKSVAEFARFRFRGNLDWDYVRLVRDLWHGPIILKGLLHPADISETLAIGIDGIGVSNHGGRQFDGAPAAIDVLPTIVNKVNGKAKIIFDSGINSGLDIVRAIALGADFVLIGRPFMYACAALGNQGGDHASEIFIDDLKNNMAQLGVSSIDEIKKLKMT